MLLLAGEGSNSYSSTGLIEDEADAMGDGRCFFEKVAWGWVFLRLLMSVFTTTEVRVLTRRLVTNANEGQFSFQLQFRLFFVQLAT